MRILDWAKKHLLSPEVVSRLLQAKGVEIKSFFSVATLEQFESIREAAVAEQERIDKKVHPRKSPASSNSSSSKTTESQSNKEIGGGRKLKVTLKRPAHEEAPPPQHAETKKAVETNSKEPTQVSPIATSQPKDTKSEHLEQTAAVPQEKPQTSSQPNSLATKQDPAPTPSVPSASQQQPHQPASTPVNPPMKAGGPPLHPGAAQPPTFPPKRPTAPMKATVSGPTPEMLARIQKHREQQAQARRSNASRGPGGAGYTGSFGRSPAGGNRGNNSSPHRGPGRPGQGSPSSGGAPFGNSIMADAMAGAGFRSQKSTPGGRHSGKKGGKNKSRNKDTHQEQTKDQTEIVRQSVNRVMASLSKNPVKKTYRKEAGPEGETTQRQVLKTSDFITVGELAGLMEQMPAKVIAKCMEMGLMVTINHRLDFETIQVLADEFGFDVELMEEYVEENLSQGETDAPEDQRPRSPIVTVMGHVDHGKTSLLDYVRKANVVAGESGGITQHIGAYEVSTPNGKVTFLDTPGHEAFTAMRARGSQVTDVIVLVVASDSAVMPQTLEVIELAKSAKVPLVVAITKCDLPTSNPDKIRAQLAERGVEVEQWGGQTSCVEVSARTGAGIDKLLETLTLETEVLELKANPTANARGTVIESKLDPGKGAMATILIQNGTLRVGDIFVCGNSSGRVRAMFDERGRSRREAGPSIPAVVIGFDETPQAGDDLVVFEDEKTAREIASKRRMAAHERELRARKHMSLEQVYDRKQSGEFSELNLIVKADVDGSAEAIAASLERLTNKEVKINIIRKAVGAIKEDDIMLASSADAVIIAFHLMPSIAMREMAEREGIEIRTYRIIYEIIEDIQGVVEGMLKPILRDEVVGEAEIREIFKIPKVGIIAGCMVKEGLVDRESRVHVFRDGVELGTTQVQSLKRHKDDAKEVKAGLECGIGLKGYENLQAGDSLVFFKEVKVARTLADVEADAAKAVAAKLDAKKK
ncbi:MAG TPA: translation initiation factor IF-2 [Fibrobacteraceae bacterium]|nr:translation initiation factor IF-2 [Fibrobacteraceae bacterium]